MLVKRSMAFSMSVALIVGAFCSAQDLVAQDKKTKSETKQAEAKSEVAKLAVGDVAPEWTLVGSDGKTYKLSDYKGKQAVVVFWYPMALTGG